MDSKFMSGYFFDCIPWNYRREQESALWISWLLNISTVPCFSPSKGKWIHFCQFPQLFSISLIIIWTGFVGKDLNWVLLPIEWTLLSPEHGTCWGLCPWLQFLQTCWICFSLRAIFLSEQLWLQTCSLNIFSPCSRQWVGLQANKNNTRKKVLDH